MLLAALALFGTGGPAAAATRPGAQGPTRSCHNRDALGVGRTIEVGGAPELGLKTYPKTLDLGDREIVLTFDDGPSGATTPDVLKALDAQCVEATFFLIGRNAQAHPELVRREIEAGHTVGHHTWDHPAVTLRNMGAEAGLLDITEGMEADDRAAGYGSWTGQPRVPFFRYPGFGDSPSTLAWLRQHGVAVFGADLWASDWIPMTPDAEFDLLMGRVRAAGRGIVLLHDIKRQTADMLPRFLAALKAEGFHIVHMVPGGAAAPTRDAPLGWSSETERTIAHLWPKTKQGCVGKPMEPCSTPRESEAELRGSTHAILLRPAAAGAGLKPSVE